MACDVLNQASASSLVKHFSPISVDLSEVIVIGSVVTGNIARNLEFRFHSCWSIVRSGEAVREVIWITGIVRVERHGSITLVV